MTQVRSAALVVILAAASLAAGGEPVRFFWAAQVARGEGAAATFMVVEHDVLAVEAGDRIQFYFAGAADSHVYLLHVAVSGAVERLFPGPGEGPRLIAGQQRYFPSRQGWFTIDLPRGREQIYLLVSAAPLVELEGALRSVASAPADGRAAASKAVVGEIARLRRLHGLAAPRAPRPTTIAGTYRAPVPDLAAIATEFTADGFYARTYVLARD
jgi:hypothetical protein